MCGKSGDQEKKRCAWASNELSIPYHDEEWGIPVHDDRVLFEFLILEGAQAGLSWNTILNKRNNYRRAFDGFDPKRIAQYDQRKVNSLSPMLELSVTNSKLPRLSKTQKHSFESRKSLEASIAISGNSLGASPA